MFWRELGFGTAGLGVSLLAIGLFSVLTIAVMEMLDTPWWIDAIVTLMGIASVIFMAWGIGALLLHLPS